MTQKCRVLQYIQCFGSITSAQAFADLGIVRLGSRIFDLRRDGYQITSETMRGKNRFGELVTYTVYRLDDGSKEGA